MSKTSWIKTNELSLGEYLVKVLDEQGKDSADFKGLVAIYGKEKLRDAYAKAKGIKRGDDKAKPDGESMGELHERAMQRQEDGKQGLHPSDQECAFVDR